MLDIILGLGLLVGYGLLCLIPVVLAVTFFMAGAAIGKYLVRKGVDGW